jgi:hypothetical protein
MQLSVVELESMPFVDYLPAVDVKMPEPVEPGRPFAPSRKMLQQEAPSSSSSSPQDINVPGGYFGGCQSSETMERCFIALRGKSAALSY